MSQKIETDLVQVGGLCVDASKISELAAIGLRSRSMAHDVNNLLQIVAGTLDNLRSEKISARSMGRLMRASDSIERCARLIRSGLAANNNVASIDVAEFLNVNIEIYRDICSSRVKLVLDEAASGACITANELALSNAMINLVKNACEAIEGPGCVVVSSDVFVGERGPYVRLCVKDNGVGIPKHIGANVFDCFFTTKGSGTGAGLANVKDFVEGANGQIEICSEVGCGTEVSMCFPCKISD